MWDWFGFRWPSPATIWVTGEPEHYLAMINSVSPRRYSFGQGAPQGQHIASKSLIVVLDMAPELDRHGKCLLRTLAHELAHHHFKLAVGNPARRRVKAEVPAFNEGLAEAVEVLTMPEGEERDKEIREIARRTRAQLAEHPDADTLALALDEQVHKRDYLLAAGLFLSALDLRGDELRDILARMGQADDPAVVAELARSAMALANRETVTAWCAERLEEGE